nr:hypothetical protein B0A51_03109 [Rachicladosporium sp. CCFEE 5018]
MAPPPLPVKQSAAPAKHDIDAEFHQRLQSSITTIDPVTGRRRWATNAEMNPRESNRQTNTEGQELRRRYRRGHESEDHEAVILNRLRAQPGELRRERSAFTADEFWAEHDVWASENDASSTKLSSSSGSDGVRSRERSLETSSHAETGDGDERDPSLEVDYPDASSEADRRIGAVEARSATRGRRNSSGTTPECPM